MLSLSNELLLLLSDQSLNFTSIRNVMEVFGYTNRKVLWSTLERLANRGDLKKTKKKDGIEFSSTSTGKKSSPSDPTHIPRPDRSWDGKWRIIFFDIPEEKRKIRDQLSAKLKEMGFARFQNSVYISVHDALDKVKDVAKSYGVLENVKAMLVEDLDVDEKREFAQKIWNLERLNEKYKEFVEKNKNGYKGGEFTSDILRYWLKRTKYEYLSILHEDPVLPKELLPTDWMGYEAQKVWEQMERILETY